MKRLLLIALVCLMGTFALPQRASSQTLRPSGSLYLYPRVGMSWYTGDYDPSPVINFWDNDGQLPWIGGLELGYDFNPHVGVGVGYDIGNFPTIQGVNPPGTNYTKRHIVTALLRWTPGGMYAKASPYFELGAMVNNGQERNRDGALYNDGDIRPAYGPLLGVGFDVALSGRASLMLGGHLGAQFSDSRTDQSDEEFNGMPTSSPQAAGPFDLLGGFGLGLKYHFKDAFSAVDVMAVDGPASLECGQTGTFTATVADGATEPVEYRWDFGDGGMGEGLVATHSFARPGTYTVTFTASNNGSMDSASTTVTCTPPPVPAGVTAASAMPNPATVGQNATFTCAARGDAPVSYSWNFGDGQVGTGATATHAYARPGTYTATCTASNAFGNDTRNVSVTVRDAAPPVAAVCTVNELNSVFFDVNSSTLTETARQALRENIDALRSAGCEGTRVRIEGFAGPGERNPQQLSEDRARAVMQFYTDNGIASGRLSMTGMGMVGGTTSKKDDTSSLRRVDSIPIR